MEVRSTGGELKGGYSQWLIIQFSAWTAGVNKGCVRSHVKNQLMMIDEELLDIFSCYFSQYKVIN